MATISDLHKGLVGHWTMNSEDVDNGQVRDRSGYDNHGTIYQNADTGLSGANGESISFNGTDGGFVRTPTQDTFSAYTVSFWIFARSLNTGGHVISTFANNAIQFRTRSGGLNFRQDDNSGNTVKVGSSLDLEKWYHVAGTWDGSQIELFIDGSSSGTQSISSMNVPGSGSGFQIGKHAFGADRAVWAKMSDVRLYKRALSQPEIKQLADQRTNPVMSVGGIDTSKVTASGGSEYTKTVLDVDYKIHEFTSDGTFSVSEGGKVDILVVGGGGGTAGEDGSGAAGAGGLVFAKNVEVSGNYSITVGSGGAAKATPGNSATGNDGANSSFGSLLTAKGGGGGGAKNGSGQSGGSGSGPGQNTGGSGSATQPNTNSLSSGYVLDAGNSGDDPDGTSSVSGGGGGAAESATNAEGGDGLYFGDAFSDDFGENGYFAGGGGGAENDTSGYGSLSGGIGGGGDGGAGGSGNTGPQGENGLPNTGGGAGGCAGDGTGASGGSGIVLIRYKN